MKEQCDPLHWSSSVTSISQNEIRLRGYRLDELMGKVRFTDCIHLALTGELPDKLTGDLFEAIFVSSIDHGTTPPSTLAARTVASTGAPINAAIAAGVLSINKHHGGAVEGCMNFLISGVNRADAGDMHATALELAKEMKAKGERAPGYGHRVHTNDPRTVKLFELARECGKFGKHCEFAAEFQNSLASISSKPLPINVDGAIAAVLCDLGISPTLANPFFIIARVPGLTAQIFEEMSRERPMRKIHPSDCDYDGTPPRRIE